MIEFIDVSKTYPNGTHALYNINLKIDKGEFVYIVGASGAGKSTFLKLITCEEKPNSGQIIVNGVHLETIRKRNIPYLRRNMGLVFQDFRLIETMNVFDNIAFAMRVVGAREKEIQKRVPYFLNMVGLSHKAKMFPSELSGGEKQRIGLARALINRPEMLIADEPTGNIDPAMSYEMLGMLSEINKHGTTVVMVTHEHVLVREFPHRIVEINNGRIVADSSRMHTPESTQEASDAAQRKPEDSEAEEKGGGRDA